MSHNNEDGEPPPTVDPSDPLPSEPDASEHWAGLFGQLEAMSFRDHGSFHMDQIRTIGRMLDLGTPTDSSPAPSPAPVPPVRQERPRRNRRRRDERIVPTNPIAPEESTISVTLDDGSVIQREMTEAERFLHSHLARVRDDYVANGDLEREIEEAVGRNSNQGGAESGSRRSRAGNRSRRAAQREEDPELVMHRRKLMGNLIVLFAMMVIAVLLTFDEDDDDVTFGPGFSPLSANDVSSLRGEKPVDWWDTADGVSTYYRGIGSVGRREQQVVLELDSKGSSVPGIRLLTAEITFNPPLSFITSVQQDQATEDGALSQLSQEISSFALVDSNSLYYDVEKLDFQGVHFAQEKSFAAHGRGSRTGFYDLTAKADTAPSSYDLYLQAMQHDASIRSTFYQQSYESQLQSFPGVMGGYYIDSPEDTEPQTTECQLYVEGRLSRQWNNDIVTSPNFANTNVAGKGQVYPPLNHGVSRLKSMTETSVVNQLRWRRLEGVTNEPKHRMHLDLKSPNCPQLSGSFELEALDMNRSAAFVLVMLTSLLCALAANFAGLTNFIKITDDESNANQRLKVNVSSLILNILLGGFESGLLFSFGLESALYVPLFVILAILYAFCTMLMMVRLTVQCWRSQMTRRVEAMRNNGQLTSATELHDACRDEANAFVRLLTVACAGGLLLATKLFLLCPEIFSVLYLTLWIPQIYSDVKIGTHRSIPISMILPTTLIRCAIPFMIWGLPSLGPPLSPQPFIRSPFDGVILPLIPRSPSTPMCVIVIGGLLVQATMLSVGHYLGPRWWVPKALLPELHNYHTAPRLHSPLGKKELKDAVMARFAPGAVQADAMGTWYYIKSLFSQATIPAPLPKGADEMSEVELPQCSDSIKIEAPDEGDDMMRQECVICMCDVEIPTAMCRQDPTDQDAGSHGFDYRLLYMLSDRVLSWLPLALHTMLMRRSQVEQRSQGLQDGGDVVAWALTPCEHLFHEECLKEWCEVKMECPTCRADIPNFID